MHFQASITKIKVFIASEGSKMVKSKINTINFKQLVFTAGNLLKTHFSLGEMYELL